MKHVTKQMQKRRQEMEHHPFFRWLNSPHVTPEAKLRFAPVVTDFVMGFADMNKWFLAYAENQTELKKVINIHAAEDATHSLWFVEDWYKLGLDQLLAWKPSQLIWWNLLCEETDIVRELGMEILASAVRQQDPVLRFVLISCMEVFGDLYFAYTEKVAEELEGQTGIEYRYFGRFHRARETGHLQNADESIFQKEELSKEERQLALSLVNKLFDYFEEMLDQVYSFGKRLNEDPRALQSDLKNLMALDLHPPAVKNPTWPLGPQTKRTRPHATQVSLQTLLQKRQKKLSQSSLVSWLDKETKLSPADKLRSFVPMWATDIVGYADFQSKVLQYKTPSGQWQERLNLWSNDLATHAPLFLRDWQSLGLDLLLSWSPGESICFYFLSDLTEIHRKNMASTKKYAMRYDSPVLRFWLMHALESAGRVLFKASRPLALGAEREESRLRLDYWAERHYLMHSQENLDLNLADFFGIPLSDEQVKLGLEIIEHIFDNMDEQFELSYRVASSKLLLAEPEMTVPLKREDVMNIEKSTRLNQP